MYSDVHSCWHPIGVPNWHAKVEQKLKNSITSIISVDAKNWGAKIYQQNSSLVTVGYRSA